MADTGFEIRPLPYQVDHGNSATLLKDRWAQAVLSLLRRCHCTVGVGSPDAVAVNVASSPGLTLWSCGCSTMTGGVSGATIARLW